MTTITPKKLEEDLKAVISSYTTGMNNSDVGKDKLEKSIDGMIVMITTVIVMIRKKKPNYPHKRKLKYFVNMMYEKIEGYEGVKV